MIKNTSKKFKKKNKRSPFKRMSLNETFTIYKEIVSNQQALLRAKETLDNNVMNKPNFLVDTCKVLVLSQESNKFRKNVGVILRVLLQDHWQNKEIKFNFQKQKKVSILFT